jgi:hypothetical protein
VRGITSNPDISGFSREHTRNRPENLIENDIVRLNPGDERKVTEGSKDVARNPVPNKNAEKYIKEIAVPRNTPSRDLGIDVAKEGMEKSGVD